MALKLWLRGCGCVFPELSDDTSRRYLPSQRQPNPPKTQRHLRVLHHRVPRFPGASEEGESWKVIGHNQREVYREPEAAGGLQGGGE